MSVSSAVVQSRSALIASDGALPKLFKRMEDQEYKGVDGYFKTILGLSDEDITLIQDRLRESGGRISLDEATASHKL